MACDDCADLLEAIRELTEVVREQGERDTGKDPAYLNVPSRESPIYARSIVLAAGTPASKPQDLIYATFHEATASAVRFQIPNDGVSQPLQVVVTELTGAARFTRAIQLVPGPQKTVRVFGATIMVTVAPVNGTNLAAQTTINGQLAPQQPDALGDLIMDYKPTVATTAGLSPQGKSLWRSGVYSAFDPAGAQPVSGYLQRGAGNLNSLADGDAGPYWLMFFDSQVVPAADTLPLYTVGPLVAGDEFSFDLTVRPEVAFATGCSYAFSTSDVSYQPCGLTGVDARVDVTGGF